MPTRRYRALARGVVLSLLCSLSGSVAARGPSITLGEITAKVRGADPGTEQALRALVSRELERLRLANKTRDERYVFSAALVRLDANLSHDGARAACVVSGTLRKATSGTIVAVMQGSGTAEDDKSALESVKARALEAAVHGAVRHVPEAL